MLFCSVLYRAHGLQVGNVLLNGRNLLRPVTGRLHTYATLELLENGTDIHTLARQMGNSVLMIERHYSKLTATMAAGQLA